MFLKTEPWFNSIQHESGCTYGLFQKKCLPSGSSHHVFFLQPVLSLLVEPSVIHCIVVPFGQELNVSIFPVREASGQSQTQCPLCFNKDSSHGEPSHYSRSLFTTCQTILRCNKTGTDLETQIHHEPQFRMRFAFILFMDL